LNAPSTISDEAYETIPSQLLPFLRPDSLGSIVTQGGTAHVEFTGLDDYLYEIQTSTNLRDWTHVMTANPTNGVMIVPDSGATERSRYYRSVLLPGF
jgi:hypothetical protein